MIFLLLLVSIALYLFFHFRSVFGGVRGTFFAAAILLVFAAGFFLREFFVGTVLNAVFTVWFCEAVLVFLVWDVVRICRRILVRRPLRVKARLLGNRIAFILGILVCTVFFAVGVPQNDHYRIREQVVSLPSGSAPFTAVFFSDLHIDPLFSRQKLSRLAADIDSVGPDLVLFGGDLADVSDSALRAEGYSELFSRVVSGAKVGAFGVNGNHEAYMERLGSSPEDWMRANGMVVLDDSTACLPKVCLTGRTDFVVAASRGTLRTELSRLAPADTSKPWIVLDHEPRGFEADYAGRIPSLVLSGHTHNGQFFPATALIGLIWELPAGFGTLSGAPWLVSSGIDSWGPPVRVGSNTEIWVLRFEPSL